jgi:hypothetical protein
MDFQPTNIVLLIAIAVPIVVFWTTRARFDWKVWKSAALAIVLGWAMNVIWASMAQNAPTAPADSDLMTIAVGFGWICPLLLVAMTWLTLRLSGRGSR